MIQTKNPVLEALKYYGISSITGAEHNQVILSFFEQSGNGWVKDDDTAWCAAFANAINKACNLPYTRKLNARSFLEIGIDTQTPELGDLVVLWRIKKDSVYGHVGYFIKQERGLVYILGGNQHNSVDISPYSVNQVLAYKKLVIN